MIKSGLKGVSDLSGKYAKIYDSSIKNKENFWKEVAEDIFWYKKPSKILNSSSPPFYKFIAVASGQTV